MSELKYIYVNDSNANKIGIKSSIKSRTYHTVQAMRFSSYIEAILFFFFLERNQRRIDAIGKMVGRGVTEANYKGRITGSWATKQPSLFWLSFASHPRRSRALCPSTHW